MPVRVGTFHQAQQHIDHPRGAAFDRLLDGGQRRIGVAGERQVVVADDGESWPGSQPGIGERVQRADREAIGGAEQCRRRPRALQHGAGGEKAVLLTRFDALQRPFREPAAASAARQPASRKCENM